MDASFIRCSTFARPYLADKNESLRHVLTHIDFLGTVGNNKRVVSDENCKELITQFNRYRLRNEDFQFSDLLGAAYEFLINMFAESAGKKGGDFYTPRDVIRTMVRLLKPRQGMSVYDPCCGSGGMLIISREYVEQSGGDPRNLRIAGQVNDGSAWAICKMNMILHGIPDADIQLEDTLLHPQHKDKGELERFDRVIANPPFSQNYTRTGMEFPERFKWGWCPTTGKKSDLMFAQHMLAVCKPGGTVATVMPHGVLFRGNAEKQIRQKWVEQDIIEAIVGLPPNLFYGAGIPACILVMRPNLSGQPLNPNKPEARRGSILFINADAEYRAGRAQNYLMPEHIEKMASTFDRYEDIPGYASRVSADEIRTNDFNLNIRRYVDNLPPPEPHDVRAHLIGGVPVAEIDAARALFASIGFDPMHAFVKREYDPKYVDFTPALADRAALRPLVENDTAVQARVQQFKTTFAAWWQAHAQRLVELPQRRNLNAVRADLLDSFVAALLPQGVLDRFKLSGVIASWWNESLPDLKTLLELGFPGVVEGWIDAIADALDDDESTGPAFDPLAHKLVRRTMGDYLHQMAATKTEIARLKAEKEAFEAQNPPEDEEEAENWNYVKDLDRQRGEIFSANEVDLKELTRLTKAYQKARAAEERAAVALAAALSAEADGGEAGGVTAATKVTEKKLARLHATADEKRKVAADAHVPLLAQQAKLKPVMDQLDAIADALKPYEQLKAELSTTTAKFRQLVARFLDELTNRCEAMVADEKQALVLELTSNDLWASIFGATSELVSQVVGCVGGLHHKYALPLQQLEEKRAAAARSLSEIMRRLGYGN